MKYTYNKGIETNSMKSKARMVVMFVSVVMFALSLVGMSSAKEVTSGGGAATVGAVVCSNVKSLSYKGDARVGELGFASIDINYSVSPCNKTAPVRIEVMLTQNIAGATPTYHDENAALSGKLTVTGVLVNKSYIAKVTVYDATTGTLLESKQIFAAANRKVGI